MGQIAAPYGLYVRKCIGARRNTAGNTHYPVTANVTGAMFYGAPVTFGAAGVVPLAASPSSTAQVVGVVQGAQWISALKPEWFPALPAGTYAAGGRAIEVMVNDDPGLVMMIQATATLNLTAVGKVAAMLNFATGNNSNGRSIASLDAASVAASGDLALRIVGVLDPGAPFPDVLVQWNKGVHAHQSMAEFTPLTGDEIDGEVQARTFVEFTVDRINDQRAEQGLPPLPTPEEREEEGKKQAEEAREKAEKARERAEQAAERAKKGDVTAKNDRKAEHPRVFANKPPEPVKKGDK